MRTPSYPLPDNAIVVDFRKLAKRAALVAFTLAVAIAARYGYVMDPETAKHFDNAIESIANISQYGN